MAKRKRKGVYARDVDKMNVLFAFVSIACMLGVFWMIWDDYAKPWKSYQRQFRVVQNEVTSQQLADEQGQLDQQQLAQLTQQRDAAEEALQGQRDQLDDLEEQLASAQTNFDLADQNLRFARSTYDTRRWEFEEARKHDGEEGSGAQREAMDAAQADVETYDQEMERLTLLRDGLQDQIDALNADVDGAARQIVSMNREVQRLQDRLATLRFDWVFYLRNAPFLDGFNPSLRINQTVNADLPMDLNFTTAPRVDRCESCHLGIRSQDFADQSQPFSAHPRLDLFVADTSSHPAGEFGCTVCHNGKGHATTFGSAVHSPDNDSEEERWEHDYGWQHIELWEWPMRKSDEIESGCLSCHVNDTWLPDAPRAEYGLELVESLGCSGCHQIDRFDDDRKPGPELTHLGSKTTPEWAYNWVMNPKSFRPETPMPRFFNLANNSDDYWQGRNQVEADAIVAYLFDSATPVELETAPSGNVDRGQQLIESIGCQGCHMVDETYSENADTTAADARFTGYRHQGPNLSGIGSKVSADWLYTWVRNPTHYWEDTNMPNLRLTQSEAADVTAYLMTLRNAAFDNPTVPAVNATLLDEVALEYMRQQLPREQAAAQLASMDEVATRNYLGGRLIDRYGCAGCHVIPGKENAGRIGTSLSEWGSKAVAQLDFGLLDLPHERRAFLEHKLQAPRSYDNGRVRSPQEQLRMPNFDLNDGEIEAIATAVLGFTDADFPDGEPESTPRRQAIEAGRAIVDQYNCRGCHIVEDRGGAVRDVIAQAKVDAGTVTSLAAGQVFGPPNLRSEGARVQPDWLYRFFKEPSTIRPWLDVRMPTFNFSDDELNALTAYFAVLDDVPYPFESTFTSAHSYDATLVREGGQLAADQQGRLQCFSCHFQGTRQPRVAQTQWAPDLALAAERLRPEWIDRWIKDPQSLQPGTNMPQFYPDLNGTGYWPALGRDIQTEIDALVSYIMSLGN